MNIVYCKDEEKIKKLLDFRKDSRVYFSVISSISELKKATEENLKYLVCIYINDDESQLEEMEQIFDYLYNVKVKKYLAAYTSHPLIAEKIVNQVQEVITDAFLGRRLIQFFRSAHFSLQKQLNNMDTVDELTELWKEVEEVHEKKGFFSRELLFSLESLKIEKSLNRQQEIFQQIKPNLCYPGKIFEKVNFNEKEFVYENNDFIESDDKETYRAQRFGFLVVEGDRIRFLPNVIISEDKMLAHMYFYPLENFSFTETLNLYWEEASKVLAPETMDRDAFLSHVKMAVTNEIIIWKVVAKGIKPQNGQNNHVIFLKEQEYKALREEKGIIIDNLGTIDFRERANILTVKKGEAIAKEMKEIESIDGLMVTGRKIKSHYLKKTPYGVGENLILNSDTGIYEATIDGMVLLTQKTISVEETLVINGDVDLDYGNVHYDKNVQVTGSIISGMHVVCGGNLIVDGVIENAAVSVDGDLLVNGVIGCHSTPLFVKGNVFLNFCENSFVDCLQEFNFKKHLLNSHLRTVGKIVGDEGSKIIGGALLSATAVEADYIGNEDETKTKVDLGANFYLDERLSQIMQTIKQIKGKMQLELSDISKFLDLKQNVNDQLKNMPVEQAKDLIEKFSLLKSLREKEGKFEEVYKELKGSIVKEFSAYMLAKKTLYPNVFLTIVGLSKKIQEYQHRVVYFLNNENLQLDRRYL